MGLSYKQYPAPGGVDTFAVTFPYLKKEHIKVYVDDIEDLGFTWDSDTIVKLSSIPTAGKVVLLKRTTPKDVLSTNYESGALLDEETLDNAQEELFYIVQEGVEAVEGALTKDVVSNLWDMDGTRVTNIGTPTDVKDATTKEYVDGLVGVDSAAQALTYRNEAEGFKNEAAASAAEVAALEIPVPTVADFEKALVVDVTGKYILGEASGGGGGLQWGVYTADLTSETGMGYLMDASLGSKTVTLHASPKVGDTVAVGDLKGSFAINPVTISCNGMLIQGISENLLLDVKNQRVTLVYSGVTDGWVITELEPSGDGWEYMPYAVMQLQHREDIGVSAGTASVGDNIRKLTHTPVNEIAGASLANNLITLPAGTYEIDGFVSHQSDTTYGYSCSLKDTGNNIILVGSLPTVIATNNNPATLKGQFTLAAQTTLKVVSYYGYVYSFGVPVEKAATGMPYTIYSDLKITKIGGNYAPKPIIRSARLQPMAGVNTLGDIEGFTITQTGALQLTITKGQCLDSNRVIPLAMTSDLALTITAPGANTVLHLAVVRLLNQTVTIKQYASEAAIAADVANIDAFRWIDFWQANGSNTMKAGYSADGHHCWDMASECFVGTLIAAPAALGASVDLASHLPGLQRVSCVSLGGKGSGDVRTVAVSNDGVYTYGIVSPAAMYLGDSQLYAWNGTYGFIKMMPLKSTTVYWGLAGSVESFSARLLLKEVFLRR